MIFFKKISIIYIILALFQIWFVIIMIKNPYIGVDLHNIEGKWYVHSVDQKTGSEFIIGDEVLEINGAHVELFPSVIRWHSLEQADSILISRDQNHLIVRTSDWNRFNALDLLSIIGEVLCFLISAAIYRWMKHSKSGRYLSYVFICIASTFMCLGASIRGDVLGKNMIAIGIILVPIVLLHFQFAFFKEKGNVFLNDNSFKFAYSLIGLLYIVFLLSFLKMPWVYKLYNVLNYLSMFLFIIGVLLNLIFLSVLYQKFKHTNRDILMIVKSVWVALFLSCMPLAFFSFFPQMLFGYTIIDSFYTSWAVLFFPFSFTYLLASKKLYDIDLVVRRFILTVLLAIFPSGIMVAILSLLFPFESEANRFITVFILLIIFISLTLYSFEYLTTKLERVIFPRKHQLQLSLKNISKNLGNISNFHDFKDIILIDIINTLQVLGGAIIFRHQNSVEVIAEGSIDSEELKSMSETSLLLHSLYTVYEISRNEEYSCFLVLASKKTNTYLGLEEKQWLGLIVSYLSVSMENIHLIRKLTLRLEQLAAHLPRELESTEIAWFRKLMFELQEKERTRIATDLHDTTMQDLFFLKRRFDVVRERLADNSEIYEQLSSIIDYIDVINMNLRQSCFELHPYLLKEVGLIRTIQKLVDLEASTASYKVEFRVCKAESVESCSLDFKRHVFRMVQELLNNARKHADPTLVRLELSATRSRLFLFYEDDGIGFESNEEDQHDGESGSGMIYLKSRVLSLGGQFELLSSQGKGLKFMADFPLAERRTAS